MQFCPFFHQLTKPQTSNSTFNQTSRTKLSHSFLQYFCGWKKVVVIFVVFFLHRIEPVLEVYCSIYIMFIQKKNNHTEHLFHVRMWVYVNEIVVTSATVVATVFDSHVNSFFSFIRQCNFIKTQTYCKWYEFCRLYTLKSIDANTLHFPQLEWDMNAKWPISMKNLLCQRTLSVTINHHILSSIYSLKLCLSIFLCLPVHLLSSLVVL